MRITAYNTKIISIDSFFAFDLNIYQGITLLGRKTSDKNMFS